ncbi:MAG: prepilin-type N-terminal cleavage/methylation domain-containing protein [Candidatus Woesebacteria bacterium]|nr:prepilin-type N-terminal cleavage/methylation domain-containing protein [Candidatus Woesebacteria bacterium]
MGLKKTKNLNKGFVLIELLIVLTIVGVISVFSAVNGPTQLQKVRDAVRKSQIDRVKKAIEEYHQDTNCYPQTIPTCTNSINNEELVYLDKIGCDPKTKLSYTYVSEISECPKWYQLYGNLEYTLDKIIDKIGCREGCGPDCRFNYGVSSSNQNLDPYCKYLTASPVPGGGTPGPTTIPEPPLQYVCAPNGACEVFENPNLSGCPDIYINDPLCQGACDKKVNTCHDDRGKTN